MCVAFIKDLIDNTPENESDDSSDDDQCELISNDTYDHDKEHIVDFVNRYVSTNDPVKMINNDPEYFINKSCGNYTYFFII